MNINEATNILSSLGYNVKKDINLEIDYRLNKILESMESRGATRTAAYQALLEMAIKKPKNITEENPWNDADDKFSKLQNTIQSSMAKNGNPKPETLAKWKDKLNDIKDNLSNPSVIAELPNLEQFLNGDSDIYISAKSNPNKGKISGDWASDVKKIRNSISSVASKNTGYDSTLARIEELAASKTDFTESELEDIESLRIALNSAKSRGEQKAIETGKVKVFRPADPRRLNHIQYRLRTANIKFTANENGTITIASNLDKAEELIGNMGSFLSPDELIERPAEPVVETLTKTFIVSPEDIEFFTDVANDNQLSDINEIDSTEDGSIYQVTGTADALDNLLSVIESEGINASETDSIPTEDETPSEEPESTSDESEIVSDDVEEIEGIDEEDDVDPTIAAAASITPEDEENY